jgi:hypothetical protein
VPHFSVDWIVANHRNRFTTATPNALAASSHAARTVRSLIRSIIDSHGRGPHLRWLRGGRKGRSLALVGVSRPRKTDTLEMVARGAVYSLLTQEIVAATAELIVVHVPGLPEQEPIEVSGRLGPFEYRVHLVGRRRTSRSNEVIAWALGVHPGPEEPDFADFCAGLLAGYGDVQRNGRALGLEVDYGRILLTVLAIGDPEELSALIDVAESSMSSPALVMTNRLIDVGFSDFARSRGFEVVHHGALAQYMRSTFELEPLDNEDRSWSIRK